MNTILIYFKNLQRFNNLYRTGEYSTKPSYDYVINANEIDLSPNNMNNIANIISNNFNLKIIKQDNFSIEFQDEEDVLCFNWFIDDNRYHIYNYVLN